jgi:hypothetical protein
MVDKVHDCSQGTTLEIICRQLNSIEEEIKEIKNDQKEYLEKVQQIEIDRAKYPSPDTVGKYMKKVDAHDIYFGILSVIMGILIALLIATTTGLIGRILGMD